MISILPEFGEKLPVLGQFTTQKPTFFLSKMLGTHKRRDFSHFRQIKFKYDICEFWLGGRALYRSGPRQRWQPNYLYTDRFKNLYSSWNRVTGIIFALDREYLNNYISHEPNTWMYYAKSLELGRGRSCESRISYAAYYNSGFCTRSTPVLKISLPSGEE